MDKINFILPNFMAYGRNEIIINLYKKYPNLFINNFKIYSFYGTFPNAIFNGGRCVDQWGKVSIKEMRKVKKYYNKNNIRITLTFTNQCLEEKHLKDKYCNQILKKFHDGYNEVLVASPILEKYIRDKYPKYKINKSITYSYLDGKPYEIGNYNLTVLDKHYNNNFEFLSDIPIAEREYIELLCDELCPDYCQKMKLHYRELSLIQLGMRDPLIKDFGKCKYIKNKEYFREIEFRNNNSKYYISPKEIQNNYFLLGYRYYKLSGRDKYNMHGFENITSYLVKEEYQLDIKGYLLEYMLLAYENDVKNGNY